MMIIIPPDHINMQRRPARHGPAAQAMMNHLTIQLPYHRPLKIEIAHEERAARDVEDGAREGFVEGSVGVTEAHQARAGTESLGEGGTEGEEGIFGRVVVVNCYFHQTD